MKANITSYKHVGIRTQTNTNKHFGIRTQTQTNTNKQKQTQTLWNTNTNKKQTQTNKKQTRLHLTPPHKSPFRQTVCEFLQKCRNWRKTAPARRNEVVFVASWHTPSVKLVKKHAQKRIIGPCVRAKVDEDDAARNSVCVLGDILIEKCGLE